MLPTFISDAFRAAPGRVLTMHQLNRHGVARRWVLALAEEELIERLIHGVYRDPAGEVPETQCLHVARAYLQQRRPTGCPPEIISGEGALGAWRAAGFTLPCAPLVLIDRRRNVRTCRPHFSTFRTDLTRIDVVGSDRLLLAAPARSVADAASNPDVTEAQLRQAVDDLRNRRTLDIVEATEAWSALRRHVGAARLARMAADGQFEQESEAERDAFTRLFAGLSPAPDCQVYLTPNIRVDFVFLDAALVIEYYGGDHDGSADHDATRVWALRRLGYEVIVVTKSMMRDPDSLAYEIRRIHLQRRHGVEQGLLTRPAIPPQPPRLQPLRTLLAA